MPQDASGSHLALGGWGIPRAVVLFLGGYGVPRPGVPRLVLLCLGGYGMPRPGVPRPWMMWVMVQSIVASTYLACEVESLSGKVEEALITARIRLDPSGSKLALTPISGLG